MAIIDPSASFEGSQMSDAKKFTIIKDGVRTVRFNDENASRGFYMYILPPYKQDSMGRGVWYRVLDVRNNFGTDGKERFIDPANSPAAYFASQCKQRYPNFAKVEEVDRDGRKMKMHPPYGSITKRVAMNAAHAADISKGAHVIEVPSYGCASVIDDHHRKPNVDGSPRPLVCDYNRAAAVWFQMDKTAKGNPWKVAVDTSKLVKLPDQLADSQYLYNLDEVFIEPTVEEVYEKLRKVIPSDIFNACMSGYSGGGSAVSMYAPAPASNPAMQAMPVLTAAPVAAIAPAMPAPAAMPAVAPMNVAPAAAGLTPVVAPEALRTQPAANVEVMSNPTISGISAADAKKWLRQ